MDFSEAIVFDTGRYVEEDGWFNPMYQNHLAITSRQQTTIANKQSCRTIPLEKPDDSAKLGAESPNSDNTLKED